MARVPIASLEPVAVPPRRSLSPNQRLKLFEAHKGVCALCSRRILAGEAWIDEHMNPREISADDSMENRRPVHVACARKKTSEIDAPLIAKSRRIRKKHLGIRKRSRMPGGRDSNIKIKMDGTVVDRATGKPI